MYQAFVCKLQDVRPHPNADRLRIATVFNTDVIVGLTDEEGDLGIFFPCGGQLSEEFANANNLIRRKDADGNHIGGFFEENRRVKALKLHGIKSEGFWCPLSLLDYIDDPATQHLTDGTSFCHGGWQRADGRYFPICKKYETPGTLAARRNRPQNNDNDTLNVALPKHYDTKQLAFYASSIPIGSRITITEKLHGTSHRQGYVLVDITRTWWQRVLHHTLKYLGICVFPEQEYKELIGTSNTILGKTINSNDYYGDDTFRRNNTVPFYLLEDDEVIYGELVGYVNKTRLVMNEQPTAKTSDKYIRKTYGQKMVYRYGHAPGQSSLFVYRIGKVNKVGTVVDYTIDNALHRANQMGVSFVPILSVIYDYDGDTDKLVSTADELANGPSTLDSSHIREGVVLHIEPPFGKGKQFALKHKSYIFKVLEDIAKDQPDTVDMEEAS